MKRVVVTGLGVVSPLGNDVSTMWDRLLKGDNAIDTLTKIDISQYPAKVGAEVKEWNIDHLVEPKEARKMDSFIQYSLLAADAAHKDSGLDVKAIADDVGIWIGSGIGGVETIDKQSAILHDRGPRRVSPFFIPMMIPNMASGQVSIYLGAKGPSNCSVTACASGTNSIGEAFRVIQRGDAIAMFAGGAEAPITPLSFAGFCSNKALSTNPDPNTACRPFDANRKGLNLGEGAAYLVLEREEDASGKEIWGEVRGYGNTNDAYHPSSMSPEAVGVRGAINGALQTAGLQPSDIDHVNAHGTGTENNDYTEVQGMHQIFGEIPPYVSTKSYTGHTLAAAGAIEAVFSLFSIKHQEIYPTLNWQTQMPEFNSKPQTEFCKAKINHVLSNSFGFGGNCSSLILSKV